jgi:hypothetical protein
MTWVRGFIVFLVVGFALFYSGCLPRGCRERRPCRSWRPCRGLSLDPHFLSVSGRLAAGVLNCLDPRATVGEGAQPCAHRLVLCEW